MTIKTNTSEGTVEYGDISSDPGARKTLQKIKTYDSLDPESTPTSPDSVFSLRQYIRNTLNDWTAAGWWLAPFNTINTWLGKTWVEIQLKGGILRTEYTGPSLTTLGFTPGGPASITGIILESDNGEALGSVILHIKADGTEIAEFSINGGWSRNCEVGDKIRSANPVYSAVEFVVTRVVI